MLKNKWVKNKKGQTLVELALILPILLVVIFGIIEFGRIFNAFVIVSNASREGARQAAVGKSYSDVRDKVIQVTPSLGLDEMPDIEDYIIIDPEDESSREYGEQISVTVKYDLPIIAPFIDVVLDPDNDGKYQLQASTSMRVEND